MKKISAGIQVVIICVTIIIPLVHAVGTNEEDWNTSHTPKMQHIQEPSKLNKTWIEYKKVKASDGTPATFFGFTLSVEGTCAIIGTHSDETASFSGKAYIYEQEGVAWMERQKLKPSDAAPEDYFGHSVDMDGQYAIVGAFNSGGSGAAYIFKKDDATWTEQAKLIPSDGAIFDEFGFTVALDGDYALVGSHADDDNGSCSGSAYVFKRDGITWTEEAKLTASDAEAESWFGTSVALNGEYAVVGAWGDDKYTGAAYIFKRAGTTWTEEAKLTASDGKAGDRLGVSVALDNSTAFIGSYHRNGATGAVYVYQQAGSVWTEKHILVASDGDPADCFGNYVSIGDDCIMVGAYCDDNHGELSGATYVYSYDGSTWFERQKLVVSDAKEGNQFGSCIAIDGDTALIGSYAENDFTGSAYVFKQAGDLFVEIKGGFGVSAYITNIGIENAFDVPWEIRVEGGFLGCVNVTKTGVIDILVGDSEKVSTGVCFGLGPISVSAWIGAEKKITNGMQILILSLIQKSTFFI